MNSVTPNTDGPKANPATQGTPRLLLLAVGVIIVALAVAALLFWQHRNETAKLEIPSASVTITNGGFSPATIRIKKGDTVTWTNSGPSGHAIASDQADGSGPQTDEAIDVGNSYSYVFDTPGTYAYRDQYNSSLKGMVIVE